MCKHIFCLNSAKCWFCSLGPIVKCVHCQQYYLACLYCSQQTNTWDRTVGNVYILQWELMSKINILRSWDKTYVCTYTYSLPDLIWLIAFSSFFPTNSSSLPSKLGKPPSSTTACMYKHTFCLNSAKCWFCPLGPIVKCAHCQQLPTVQTREIVIVVNGQILQWDLMSKNQHFTELRQKVRLYIHAVVLLRGLPSLEGKNKLFVGKKTEKRLAQPNQTDYSSAQKRFAKFGCQTRTFCHKKVAKVIAKLESDRL